MNTDHTGCPVYQKNKKGCVVCVFAHILSRMYKIVIYHCRFDSKKDYRDDREPVAGGQWLAAAAAATTACQSSPFFFIWFVSQALRLANQAPFFLGNVDCLAQVEHCCL